MKLVFFFCLTSLVTLSAARAGQASATAPLPEPEELSSGEKAGAKQRSSCSKKGEACHRFDPCCPGLECSASDEEEGFICQ